MANAQQQEMDMDKMRKLQEMKQQEEEFDKHLAQTVPVSSRFLLLYYSNAASEGFVLLDAVCCFRIYRLPQSANSNQTTTPR